MALKKVERFTNLSVIGIDRLSFTQLVSTRFYFYY